MPGAMEDRELFERQYASLRGFCALIGRASPGARVFERGEVIAAIVPATPDRSVVNSVTYGAAAELEAALPDLAEAYEEAGVRAWTVWVPHDDAEAVRVLERAGHRLDAQPEAMAMELSAFAAPPPTDLDLDPQPSVTTVARLNDRAYDFGGDHFERALQSAPAVHCYVTRLDGQPATCVAAHDHDGDSSITFVATIPEARGRGLAGQLLAHALHEARARGCATTSLQATNMGRSIYTRLGYRELGPVQMWERRAGPGDQ
jgi:GNAT superfamily N-acetyltransferase